MKKFLAMTVFTAASLVLPACTELLMAAMPPVVTSAAKAPAGTYAVEPGHTQIVFNVLHMGFTNFYGTFSGASGVLAYTPKKLSGMSVSISVPVESVSTTSAKLNEELKAADWLDAAHYPAMVFRSSAVTQTGPNSADVAGTLKLHGVTKPLTLHASFVGSGTNILDKKQTIGFQLTGSLKRSDFGVSKYIPLIGDDVSITIAAAFEKQ